MSYKITLTKINSTHQNLRTNEVEGECQDLPEVGKRFMLLGKGLEFGTRMVMTTEVTRRIDTERAGKSVISFSTANSVYELEYEAIV